MWYCLVFTVFTISTNNNYRDHNNNIKLAIRSKWNQNIQFRCRCQWDQAAGSPCVMEPDSDCLREWCSSQNISSLYQKRPLACDVHTSDTTTRAQHHQLQIQAWNISFSTYIMLLNNAVFLLYFNFVFVAVTKFTAIWIHEQHKAKYNTQQSNNLLQWKTEKSAQVKCKQNYLKLTESEAWVFLTIHRTSFTESGLFSSVSVLLSFQYPFS